MAKLHTGKRGGKYVVRKGRKVYVSKSRRTRTRRSYRTRSRRHGYRRRSIAKLCAARNRLNCERHPSCKWGFSNRCVSKSRIFFGPAMRPVEDVLRDYGKK